MFLRSMSLRGLWVILSRMLRVRRSSRLRNVSFDLEAELARRLRAAVLAPKERLVRGMLRTRAAVPGLVLPLARGRPLPLSRKLCSPLAGFRLMRPSYPFHVGLAGRLRPTGLDSVWAMVAPSLAEAQGARLWVYRCSPC